MSINLQMKLIGASVFVAVSWCSLPEERVIQALGCGRPDTNETALAAIREGAVQRVRRKAKAMTVAVVMASLLSILLGSGTGSEVMTRIAAPMVGGLVTAPLLSMLVIPAAWYLLNRRRRPEPEPAHAPDGALLPSTPTLTLRSSQ